MKLTIEIELENASFREAGWEQETVSILSRFMEKLEAGEVDKYGGTNLLDSNGNTVGTTWIGAS